MDWDRYVSIIPCVGGRGVGFREELVLGLKDERNRRLIREESGEVSTKTGVER